ncbi:sulfotransferase family protein [Aliiruegeria haliotis]|uniref:Sulfotransferase family protein n=1 Tax=Aliiruegeria haliotis TaxID=1280846 RepID=A0A2T0RYI5_9RHOB|nr:sulfotransferase [Aliiruegeria haliotis]PRY26244.1 sulfotransferase family protein [Aliiruegeria haliotis]
MFPSVPPEKTAQGKAPIFLFGVGAQKAGTTWLYDYLYQNPAAVLPVEKQMDYFSVRFQPERFKHILDFKMHKLKRLADERIKMVKKGDLFGDADEILSVMDSVLNQFQPDRYIPYYQSLLRSKEGATLTADITPEYACFNVEQYRKMRTMAVEGGFRPKVVFLMRDPLERCFSQLRMLDRFVAEKGERLKGDPAHKRFLKAIKTDRCERFTRYGRTVRSLEKVFRKDELFYGLYEDFFNNDEVQRLCDFLEIPFVDPDFKHRANASPRKKEPSEADKAAAREYYAEVYSFARKRFGEERINRLWTF